MTCPYDTNGDADCHICSRPNVECYGNGPIMLPVVIERVVPMEMSYYGFGELIWYLMQEELFERLGTDSPDQQVLIECLPNQQADPMTWRMTYPTQRGQR